MRITEVIEEEPEESSEECEELIAIAINVSLKLENITFENIHESNDGIKNIEFELKQEFLQEVSNHSNEVQGQFEDIFNQTLIETNEVCETIREASIVNARLKIESALYNYSKHQSFENQDKICLLFEDKDRHLLAILKHIYLLLIDESFGDNCEELITTITNIDVVQFESESLIDRKRELVIMKHEQEMEIIKKLVDNEEDLEDTIEKLKNTTF